jgi:hypothetical protein
MITFTFFYLKIWSFQEKPLILQRVNNLNCHYGTIIALCVEAQAVPVKGAADKRRTDRRGD